MSTVLVKADLEGDWTPGLQARHPGLKVRYYPDIGDPADITYALVWQPPAGMLAGFPNLKVIYSIGAGIDHLAADPQLPKNLPVVRMVDPGLTAGMAAYVTWAAMHLHRRVFVLESQQRKRQWIEEPVIVRPSKPSTVGILGLGTLGRACARQLVANGFKVAGWSRSGKQVPNVTSFTGADGFETVLQRSDIVVSLLPLTGETRGILNAANFAKLPKGAGLINVGRGAQLVEADLITMLDEGHMSGAVLDVFNVEPPADDNPLWRHEKVLVTPHIGSVTDPASAGATVAQSIAGFEAGKPLANLVDWEKGY